MPSRTVSWTPPATRQDGAPISTSDLSGFRIDMSEDGGTFYNQATVAPTQTSFVADGLTVGHSYRFRVSAVDLAGLVSAPAESAPVAIPVPPNPPSPPGNVTVT